MTLNGATGDFPLIACHRGLIRESPLLFRTHIDIEIMKDRKHEKFVAVCSFFAAVALAFTSLVISEDHDITAGVLMMCAQFLTLTATIFGIDYKFTNLTQPKTHDD